MTAFVLKIFSDGNCECHELEEDLIHMVRQEIKSYTYSIYMGNVFELEVLTNVWPAAGGKCSTVLEVRYQVPTYICISSNRTRLK